MTGESIVVNPDKQLLNLAESKDWRIIEPNI
jgi:phosphoserine phosphatase